MTDEEFLALAARHLHLWDTALLGILEETPAGGVVRCSCGWRSEPITDRYVDVCRVLTAHRATGEQVVDVLLGVRVETT